MHSRGTLKCLSAIDGQRVCVCAVSNTLFSPTFGLCPNTFIYTIRRVILSNIQGTKTLNRVSSKRLLTEIYSFVHCISSLIGNCLWHLGLLLKLAFLLLCICFLAYSQVCIVFSVYSL